MRFDELIRPSMLVRDVKREHPETARIFETYGFRGPCDDCSIEQVSRKYGLQSQEIVAELNAAITASS